MNVCAKKLLGLIPTISMFYGVLLATKVVAGALGARNAYLGSWMWWPYLAGLLPIWAFYMTRDYLEHGLDRCSFAAYTLGRGRRWIGEVLAVLVWPLSLLGHTFLFADRGEAFADSVDTVLFYWRHKEFHDNSIAFGSMKTGETIALFTICDDERHTLH